MHSNGMGDNVHEVWTGAGICTVGGWCPHMSPLPHILIQCQLMPSVHHPLAAATHFPRHGYRARTRYWILEADTPWLCLVAYWSSIDTAPHCPHVPAKPRVTMAAQLYQAQYLELIISSPGRG